MPVAQPQHSDEQRLRIEPATLTLDVLCNGCLALGLDPDAVLQGTATIGGADVPEGLKARVFAEAVADRFVIAGDEETREVDWTSVPAADRSGVLARLRSQFAQSYRLELQAANLLIGEWKEHFALYPDASEDDQVSALRSTLTKLEPDRYDAIVCRWPLRRFFVWAEQSRVRSEFEDLEDDARKATGRSRERLTG